MKNTVTGAIYLSLAASIWGGMYVVSKYVLEFVPPFTLVWLRYAVAFIFLFLVMKIVQFKTGIYAKLKTKDWLLLAWIGFIGYFVSIGCQFIGTKLSDAHTGALITSATPAFIVIFARFVLKETLTLRKIVSLSIATVGVAVVVGWNSNMGDYFWGSIILVGAAITWALLSVYVKLASYHYSSIIITTYAILFALVFTTPFMLWEMQTYDILFHNSLIIPGILYLGLVSTAGAFFLWNSGLEKMDAGIGSLFFFFQPLVGAFLGWFLLDEYLGLNFFVGGALILLGVLIVTVQTRKLT